MLLTSKIGTVRKHSVLNNKIILSYTNICAKGTVDFRVLHSKTSLPYLHISIVLQCFSVFTILLCSNCTPNIISLPFTPTLTFFEYNNAFHGAKNIQQNCLPPPLLIITCCFIMFHPPQYLYKDQYTVSALLPQFWILYVSY